MVTIWSQFPALLFAIYKEAYALQGWATMNLKVYEVDSMLCPKCGGVMKVIALLTEHAIVDLIIEHPGLTFVADKPPPFLARLDIPCFHNLLSLTTGRSKTSA